MKMSKNSIQIIIDKQINKWTTTGKRTRVEQTPNPTITISREAGSGGNILADRLADALNYDLFDQALIQRVAESAHTSAAVVASVDEKFRSVMEDWIADWTNAKHLWLDDYLKHLMKVIGAIGKHGNAVIVGRGSNFILSREDFFRVFRVRVVASVERRAANLALEKQFSADEAIKYINRTDAERRAFVRRYFNADIADPNNYDLVLNMDKFTVDEAVQIIRHCMRELGLIPKK